MKRRRIVEGEDDEPKHRRVERVSASTEHDRSASNNTAALQKTVVLEPCGIIERIKLKNIFCHDYLDFDQFTPNVNLLQGANGSGKSSIVAAIIAGLGGSSKSTDRCKNMKNIIQQGKNSASIEIHLRNKGHLAYKHHLYGDKVIVERKVTASGSSSYKLKAANGQIVSTKKDDLNRILDWYNFQVDNPIIILNQERAKTFLSSTNPKTMFDFFMSATQLKQCKETLLTIQKDIQAASTFVKHKKENLVFLDKEVKDWEKKAQAMKTLEKKRDILTNLRRQKAWAEVEEEETEMEKVLAMKNKYEQSLVKVNEVIKVTEAASKELRKKQSDNDQEMVQLVEQAKACEAERISSNSNFIEAKKVQRERLNAMKNLKKQSFEKERDVAILKEKLEKDNTLATRIWENTIAELNGEKEKLQNNIDELELQLKTEQIHEANISQSFQEKDDEYHHGIMQEKAIRNSLVRLQSELHNLKGEKDNLTVFGQFMPRLIREIDVAHSRRAFKNKPIGPLGSFIKVKDQNWIHIVENVTVTKGLLSSFLVSCSKDHKTLYQIFNSVVPRGVMKPQVIISPFRNKLHDVARFETGTRQYFSMWSIIQTDNIHVGNTLLDQLHVESILLVPSANEANDLLIEAKHVPRNCKKAMTLRGDTYFPDPNFKVYSGTGNMKVQFLQISVEDKIRDLESNINNTKLAVQDTLNENLEKKRELEILAAEKKKSVSKQNFLTKNLNVAKRQLEELKNREIPPPPDVYQLKNDLEENVALKLEIDAQLEKIKEEISECEVKVKEAEQRLKNARDESEKIKGIISEHETQSSGIQEKATQKKKELAAYGNKKTEFEAKFNETSASLQKMHESISEKINRFLSVYGERTKPRESKKEIERKLVALQNAIHKEEANYGDLEVITSTCRLKLQKYKEIELELRSQQSFISKMKVSLIERQSLLNTTKRLLSLVLRTSFNANISLRKLKGEMIIDFKAETLKILMSKDIGDSSSELQSLQMMSGGERSFATVSFILSLWEIVRSPIRIMDEFDIFMDVVSRNQCVEMIIGAVQKNIQYIMVSPLEYRHKSENLQVFRMPNPERRVDGSEEI